MKSQTLRQEATSLPPRTLKRKKPVYAESSSEDDTPLASSPMKSNGQEATSLPPRTLKRKKPIVYAESSSEDDTPLASSPMKTNGKSTVKQESSGTDAQDDEDVSNKRRKSNGKPPRKKIKDEDEDDEDDDQPIMPAKSSAGRKQKRTKSKPDSDAEIPLPKTTRHKKVKEEESNSLETEVSKKRKRATKGKTEETEGASPTKAQRKKKEEEEEVFRWWENEADPNGDDGTVKWQTLEHNGVIFPPPYEPLPGNVKMKYKGMFLLWAFLSPYIYRPVGEPVDLSYEAEEVAGFYAALLESDHAKDTTFNNNFFDDWKTVMKKHPPVC